MARKEIRVSLAVDVDALGASMRAWRLENDLLQDEAASLIGITGSWWCCIEGGMRAHSKRGESPSLRVFISIVNLIHEDDSPQCAFNYFKFE